MTGARDRGATLAEMLVVMVVVSILAVAALPMAETGLQRSRESALRETLRSVRTAIDRFHADWRGGAMAEEAEGVSAAGFPRSLAVLVQGVAPAEEGAAPLRYLRRLPENPFATEGTEGWRLIGYAQDPGNRRWNGEDVYDLRAVTDRTALDGSAIDDW